MEDSVTLSWLSPHRDGGARIFRYVIEKRNINRLEDWIKVKEVDSSDTLLCVVEKLVPGTPYIFRVYAENEIGAGSATELHEAVIPRSQMGK